LQKWSESGGLSKQNSSKNTMNLNNSSVVNGISTVLKAKTNRLYNKPIKPKVIAYSVTWRCNAKCPMCGLQTMPESAKNPANELTAADIETAFKDPALNSLDLIRFTGGEPFLKSDFTQTIDAIYRTANPKIFYITTNGSLPEKVKAFLEFFKNEDIKLNIQVSFDALSEINDKIRAIPGLSKKALETLNILKTAKTEMPNLIAGVNQTILRENLNEIQPMNALMREMNLEHKIYIAVNSHESTILSEGKKTFEYSLASDFNENEIHNLYDSIASISKSQRKFKGITDINFLWYLVEKFLWEGSKQRALKKPPYLNVPCQAAFLYFRLMPNGDVMPCTLKPVVMGNLKKDKFSDFWYSKKADDFRNKEVKHCAGCWVECDIVSNFVYSTKLFGYFLKNLFLT